mgnify:CR=1 FL=1
MTPKEKAEELVSKMAISTSYGYNYTGGDDIPMYKNKWVKECALIAVDEIIRALSDEQDWYWDEVKQEIEKL